MDIHTEDDLLVLTGDISTSPRRDRPGGPLHEISTDMTGDLFGLVDWANRTAHTCGAVPAATTMLGGSDAEQHQAYEILYPGSYQWCASPGGMLPGPGEQPGPQVRRTVTHSLPGLGGSRAEIASFHRTEPRLVQAEQRPQRGQAGDRVHGRGPVLRPMPTARHASTVPTPDNTNRQYFNSASNLRWVLASPSTRP
ncbi:hypothetical protein ACIBF6_10175 [Streptosporangium amethystogenes]|uniref:hypothetical protein n=1 Tax=Streptosporangium amethystogenes TaxID=2002 RepID=UPI0037B0EDDC